MNILVTGGAGFIGSHLIEKLVAQGQRVRVLDALVAQVHGDHPAPRARLPQSVEFLHANVAGASIWIAALDGIEVVYHLAAEVGVEQSMYEIARYVNANTMGTAFLLQHLATGRTNVKKLIVASSMSIYGEGAYHCDVCGGTTPRVRDWAQLERQQWDVLCANCASEMKPIPTPESKPLQPASVYAISKRDQEELCLSIGRAYNIPTVALRFFNVYGVGQSLSNPYTGIAPIFGSRLLNHLPPLVFEDGQQSRDFVHVSDIVQALLLALEREQANYQTLSIGTGRPHTVLEVAKVLADTLQIPIAPQIVNKYRMGDIRHCFADIRNAASVLGYSPKVEFKTGMREFAAYLATLLPNVIEHPSHTSNSSD